MSDETGLEDFSLIDLFRSEVETHSELLSTALLALERIPGDTSRIDEMMRAAHSIKGAARVVGVEPAVSVAHVMEDCFVAAQKKAIGFSPGDIDVLLRGVDLLARISSATRDPKAWISRKSSAARSRRLSPSCRRCSAGVEHPESLPGDPAIAHRRAAARQGDEIGGGRGQCAGECPGDE